MVTENALVDFDAGNTQEMALRLAGMKNKLDIVAQFFKEIMVPDVDYGTVPGTPKPGLFKPGAEKLCELYGYAIEIADKREERDFKTGFYLAEVKVRLRHRATGEMVAEGVGEANVYEAKYRWRWVSERDLPRGIDTTNLVSKEYTRGADKWTKYRLENPDLFDLWNTVLKMAKKRALVDATLSATRSSGIFSQDEADFNEFTMSDEDDAPGATPAPKRAPQASNIKINFGKHTGKSLTEIYEEDPSYIDWLIKNAKEEKVRIAASDMVKTARSASVNISEPQETNSGGPSPEDEAAYYASLESEGR